VSHSDSSLSVSVDNDHGDDAERLKDLVSSWKLVSAAQDGKVQTVKLLLAHDEIDVNAQDKP
jgi:hypothetical protein